jgi:hypothetical protein
MRRLAPFLVVGGTLILGAAAPALAQSAAAPSEIQALRQEIQKLQERLNKLEQVRQAPAPAPPETMQVSTQSPPAAAAPGEREVPRERGSLLEVMGLPKPEVAGTRFAGFFVGSFNYNSRIPMVPEFAGGAPALSDPGRTNFRFDKFGLSASKLFAPWLFASAAVEIESHRDRHTHGFAPSFGCAGGGICVEQFGAEEAETEVTLDKFNITGIAPLGNGLSLSVGRFDVPFGIERHDEPLNLTATNSEVFEFGRPQRMTGLQSAYQFTPWLDATVWAVNRWESETTHDPFDDNNRDKTFGGRIGLTPFPTRGLLNFGIGGFAGPEQEDTDRNTRWVIDADATWSPLARLLFALEAVYGGEDQVSMRQRGLPFAAPAAVKDANWWGFYLLTHYDVYDWLGLNARYGFFDDMDGGRTGVAQRLWSATLGPVFHLSRLIPDLRPTGAAFARTRHPIDWVNVKLEYRYNESNRPVFSDAKPGVPILDADHSSHQVQLQFVVNF